MEQVFFELAHLSGFFSGLCSPDLGTARKLCTKGSISSSCVSGSLIKGSPLRGSGMDFDLADRLHSPFTANREGALFITVAAPYDDELSRNIQKVKATLQGTTDK